MNKKRVKMPKKIKKSVRKYGKKRKEKKLKCISVIELLYPI